MKNIAANGNPGSAGLDGAFHHLQDFPVGIHLGPPGNDHRYRTTGHHFPEGIQGAGVGDFNNISPYLGTQTGRMFYYFGFVFVLDFFPRG